MEVRLGRKHINSTSPRSTLDFCLTSGPSPHSPAFPSNGGVSSTKIRTTLELICSIKSARVNIELELASRLLAVKPGTGIAQLAQMAPSLVMLQKQQSWSSVAPTPPTPVCGDVWTTQSRNGADTAALEENFQDTFRNPSPLTHGR